MEIYHPTMSMLWYHGGRLERDIDVLNTLEAKYYRENASDLIINKSLYISRNIIHARNNIAGILDYIGCLARTRWI